MLHASSAIKPKWHINQLDKQKMQIRILGNEKCQQSCLSLRSAKSWGAFRFILLLAAGCLASRTPPRLKPLRTPECILYHKSPDQVKYDMKRQPMRLYTVTPGANGFLAAFGYSDRWKEKSYKHSSKWNDGKNSNFRPPLSSVIAKVFKY